MAEDFRDFSQQTTRFFFSDSEVVILSCHGGFSSSSSRSPRQFWTQYRQVIHAHGSLGHPQISADPPGDPPSGKDGGW